MDVNSFVIGYQKGKASVPPASGGGVVELNIAYGDTAPEDTTKLWVKTSEVENIEVVTTTPVGDGNYVASTLRTVLPAPTSGIAVTAVGNKIYLFGGYQYGGAGNSNKIYRFNSENNKLTEVGETLPTACNGASAVADGKKIYFLCDGTNAIHVFNTENETLSTLNITLPANLRGCATCMVDGVIYMFGGYENGAVTPYVYKFDTKTNESAKAVNSFSSAIYGHCAASVGKIIYVFGGSQNNVAITTIHMFNTENETFSTLSTRLTKATSYMRACALGNEIYLFGGIEGSVISNKIQVFNTDSKELKVLSEVLPLAVRSLGEVTLGEKIYLFGGATSSSTGTDMINVFSNTPVFNLTKNHLLIVGSINIGMLESAPSIDIGVRDVYVGTENNESTKVPTAFYNGEEWETV